MILITGAGGAMGSVFIRKLREKGARVRACVLPSDPGLERMKTICDDVWPADICNRQALEGMCRGITTVYHLAAIIISKDEGIFQRVNVDGTQNIIDEAKRSGVRHVVYISSASVLYPASTPYSLSKKKAEAIVSASGIPFTIIRPTLVYGKTGGQEFDMYLAYLKKFPVVPFIGSGESLKRPVWVDDIIDGLVAVEGREKCFGKIYNFSGGEAISMLDFSALCLKLLGIARKPIIKLPVPLCLALACVFRYVMKDPPLKWQVIAGLTQDANLDPTEAARDLGYNPAAVTRKLPECFPRVKE
jgi:nucleoside-diphosphate-sugar epimerase